MTDHQGLNAIGARAKQARVVGIARGALVAVACLASGCVGLKQGDIISADDAAGANASDGSDATLPADADRSPRDASGPADANAPMFFEASGGDDSALDTAMEGDGGVTPTGADGCAPAATSSVFYVDNRPDAGPCVFPTVTAAANAAKTSSASTRTIRVARGWYNEATGETFPIVIRDGISLVGDGAGTTLLSGVGPVAVRTPTVLVGPISAANVVSATLVVGDASRATTIAGVSLESGLAEASGTEAIVCDQGNQGNEAASENAPNTVIDHVVMTGFEVGVRVTWSVGSSCNVSMLGSLVQNGAFGVVLDGSTTTSGDPLYLVAARIGDGTAAGGNTFLNLDQPIAPSGWNLSGAGIVVGDGVGRLEVLGNSFHQDASGGVGDVGIWAVPSTDVTGATYNVEGNDFGPLSNVGIMLWGEARLDRLVQNTFHDISMVQLLSPYGWLGAGLVVGGYGNQERANAVVRYARKNTFINNDMGVTIRAPTALPDYSFLFLNDFGSGPDPGGNTFCCNSAPQQLTGWVGGDVLLDVEAPQPTLDIPFVGNIWDHVPPTTAFGASPAESINGSDLYIFEDAGADGSGAFGPRADLGDAAVACDAQCTGGRVP